MSIWDDVTGFVSGNKDWLGPVAQAGLSAIKQNSTDNAQSQYIDYLKQRENSNFGDAVTQANYANALQANHFANAGAKAAAAAKNNAAKMAAAKTANAALQQTYKNILKMYAPYRQVASTLLPQMSQTYQNSLGLQNALAQYVSSPAQVAKLDASVPAYQIQVPLPSNLGVK